jgi:hypothetical protein
MKYSVDLIRGGVLERIRRSQHGVVRSYEQRITSSEGEYLVTDKVYKLKKEGAPDYFETMGALEVKVDPTREIRTLCWQIPVPHETVAETVCTYEVSKTLSFVVRPSTCYFQGSTPCEIAPWLAQFL